MLILTASNTELKQANCLEQGYFIFCFKVLVVLFVCLFYMYIYFLF